MAAGLHDIILGISIHAPREGSDPTPLIPPPGRCNFNPRSPRGERPAPPFSSCCCLPISIHAPREGSDQRLAGLRHPDIISIHAPREGSDAGSLASEYFSVRFQSTLPARGATKARSSRPCSTPISIHAPREGSDCLSLGYPRGYRISIHAPREGSDTAPESHRWWC